MRYRKRGRWRVVDFRASVRGGVVEVRGALFGGLVVHRALGREGWSVSILAGGLNLAVFETRGAAARAATRLLGSGINWTGNPKDLARDPEAARAVEEAKR